MNLEIGENEDKLLQEQQLLSGKYGNIAKHGGSKSLIYLGVRSKKNDTKPPVNPYSIIPSQIYVGLNGQIQAKINVDHSQTSGAMPTSKGWSELVLREHYNLQKNSPKAINKSSSLPQIKFKKDNNNDANN